MRCRSASRAVPLLLALCWSAALVPLQVHVHGSAGRTPYELAATGARHAVAHNGGDACPICIAAWNVACTPGDPLAVRFDSQPAHSADPASDPACRALRLPAVRGPPPSLA